MTLLSRPFGVAGRDQGVEQVHGPSASARAAAFASEERPGPPRATSHERAPAVRAVRHDESKFLLAQRRQRPDRGRLLPVDRRQSRRCSPSCTVARPPARRGGSRPSSPTAGADRSARRARRCPRDQPSTVTVASRARSRSGARHAWPVPRRKRECSKREVERHDDRAGAISVSFPSMQASSSS